MRFSVGTADRLQHSESDDGAWSVGVLRDRELNHALMATIQLLCDPCTNALALAAWALKKGDWNNQISLHPPQLIFPEDGPHDSW